MTILIVFVFLFNLWIMADEMKIIWKQWMNGLELDFWTFSGFGIMDWVIAEYLVVNCNRDCTYGEKQEKMKNLLLLKRCGSSSQNGSYGEIEERNTV